MNNMPLVIFRMVAHNSEKTIAHAIESVLNQTYANLELHICIRASTDSTADIAVGYASKDPRVRVIINKQAFAYDEGNDIKDYYKDYDVNNDYFCFMDGDDVYTPDFLEKMIPFAQEYNLDIAVGGRDRVDFETGELLNRTMPEEIYILEGEKFDLLLPVYYFLMRARWGKLIRLSLLDKLDFSRIIWVFYCDDALEMLEYYRCSDRVGYYPKEFYRWFDYGTNLTYKWDKRRIDAIITLHEYTMRYIKDKAGRITDTNYAYLLIIYNGDIRYTVEVMLQADISMQEKLDGLYKLIVNESTKRIIDHKFNDDSRDGDNPYYQNMEYRWAPSCYDTYTPIINWINEHYTQFQDADSISRINEINGYLKKWQQQVEEILIKYMPEINSQ